MVMSTPILDEATEYIRRNILIDYLDVFDVGPTITRGFQAMPATLTAVQHDVQCLVQTMDIPQPIEGAAIQRYSIKVPRGTFLKPGQVVWITRCWREPSFQGVYLLIDSVSENGAALLRKATATRFHQVDGTGKEQIS